MCGYILKATTQQAVQESGERKSNLDELLLWSVEATFRLFSHLWAQVQRTHPCSAVFFC